MRTRRAAWSRATIRATSCCACSSSLRATPAVTLFDRICLRAQMDVEHYGDRYADAANTSKLPAYTVINASVSLGSLKNIRLLGLWRQPDQHDRPLPKAIRARAS